MGERKWQGVTESNSSVPFVWERSPASLLFCYRLTRSQIEGQKQWDRTSQRSAGTRPLYGRVAVICAVLCGCCCVWPDSRDLVAVVGVW